MKGLSDMRVSSCLIRVAAFFVLRPAAALIAVDGNGRSQMPPRDNGVDKRVRGTRRVAAPVRMSPLLGTSPAGRTAHDDSRARLGSCLPIELGGIKESAAASLRDCSPRSRFHRAISRTMPGMGTVEVACVWDGVLVYERSSEAVEARQCAPSKRTATLRRRLRR